MLAKGIVLYFFPASSNSINETVLDILSKEKILKNFLWYNMMFLNLFSYRVAKNYACKSVFPCRIISLVIYSAHFHALGKYQRKIALPWDFVNSIRLTNLRNRHHADL